MNRWTLSMLLAVSFLFLAGATYADSLGKGTADVNKHKHTYSIWVDGQAAEILWNMMRLVDEKKSKDEPGSLEKIGTHIQCYEKTENENKSYRCACWFADSKLGRMVNLHDLD